MIVLFGTACDSSQKAVVKNFSEETGMTQQESQQYIENISEDELISYYELSKSHTATGEEIFNIVLELDCDNYIYEWETLTLSCLKGMSELVTFGNINTNLGEIFKVMGDGYSFTKDYKEAITLIDKLNESLKSEIMVALLDENIIEEMIKTNLYNKSIIQTEQNDRLC